MMLMRFIYNAYRKGGWKKIPGIFLGSLLIISFVGCRNAPSVATPSTPYATIEHIPATVTLLPTEIILLSTTTSTVIDKSELTSTPTEIPACVILGYEENAQVEMISPQGVRVLVDVYAPGLLSTPASEGDILLTTHTHWDHINSDFLDSFPGKQLMIQDGRIEVGDVRVQGIPSAHNADDAPVPEGGTNYIYLVEMSGLRIAHFGDIGQDALSPEQLDALGQVDVAITQLANPYSDMNAENQKGINLMEQVTPKLIIPTHVNLDILKLVAARRQGLYSSDHWVTICPADLPDHISLLLLGEAAARFGERLSFPKVDW